MLHDIQDKLGFIPAEVVPAVADELNLSVAEVHGVVTFYRDFRQVAPGRRILRVCRGEACQANGAELLVDHLASRTSLRPGQTSHDGDLTIEDVFCLGNCALGPSIEVDARLYGRITTTRVDEFVRSDP